jgi:riboflavin synthase
MFTGIIETSGEVVDNLDQALSKRILIRSSLNGLQSGESIAINGVCLTLLPGFSELLAFDVSPETLKLTTLGDLSRGASVNIERAMLGSARFGGHYVSGHIDTTAFVQQVTKIDHFVEMIIGGFGIPANQFLLQKGSISLDGVSLTINEVMDGSIKIMLVPHTLAMTTLGKLAIGQRINVEFDYMTRIIAHQLEFMRLTTV